jgi:hypothetical protein
MDLVDWLHVRYSGVLVYLADNTQQDLRAFDWYKAYILAGARQHGFPMAYLTILKRLPERRDPNFQNQRENQISDCGGRPAYLDNG